jgi:hypothetical protein
MKVLLIWGQKFRSGFYEVRVDLQDDSGRIYNEVLNFPAKDGKDVPDEKTTAVAVDDLVIRVEAKRVMEAEELVQAPIRKAEATKEDFMSAVSAGLIKADEALAELQAVVAAKPVEEPIKELG